MAESTVRGSHFEELWADLFAMVVTYQGFWRISEIVCRGLWIGLTDEICDPTATMKEKQEEQSVYTAKIQGLGLVAWVSMLRFAHQ